MIEAFANESETANIERESNGFSQQAFSCSRHRPDRGHVSDIAHIAFFTDSEDGSRLIPTSPTAHTPGYSGEKTDLQTTNRATQLAHFA